MNVTPRPRARTAGGEIAYTDMGEGSPLLLLHGFPLWSFEWRDLAALFASRFRVIVPDLLGAGDSDKPAGIPLNLPAQTGYVRELLAHLNVERFAVVGHGIGGGIAQLLALEGAGVDAMVLLDSVAFDGWPSKHAREMQSRIPMLHPNEATVRDVLQATFDLGVRHPIGPSDSVFEAYARPFLQPGGPEAFLRFVAALDGLGLSGREDDLERIAIPVLIMWGEDDAFFPIAVAERLNDAIPSSTLALLPGCGHFLVDEAAATLGPLILEYLRAMYLRAPHGHPEAKEGVVMLQLERRPPWVDLAEDEADDWFDTDDAAGEPAP